MAGLTDEGFEIKTLQEILSDVEARQRAASEIGPTQDYSPQGALGQLNGTFASQFAELWELAGLVYSSADPETAMHAALVALASLTGTRAREAEATLCRGCVVNLDAGASLPVGSRASVTGRPDLVFECITEGVENTGGSADDFEADFRCLQTGPIVVNAGTLEVVDESVTGWNSVTNPEDGETGRNADNSIQLRERRQAQLALRGGSTVSAIRADLLDSEAVPEFEDIETVEVLENPTDVVDANGLPPHSIEVILDDGDTPSVADDLIAQAIYDSKAAGIATNGLESGTATDDGGIEHTINFSRVTRLDVWIEAELEVNSQFPVDGLAQVQAAFVARGGTLRTGSDVIALFIRAAAFEVAGVVDVPSFAIGFSASPTLDDNLEIGVRERAAFDTSRTGVTLA